MEQYNYKESMKQDIRDWIKEELEYSYDSLNTAIKEKDVDFFIEALWTADSVTGNGVGSYTINTWKAEQYVLSEDGIGNLQELMWEGFIEDETFVNHFKRGNWEALDVIIRCGLLEQCIAEVLDEGI